MIKKKLKKNNFFSSLKIKEYLIIGIILISIYGIYLTSMLTYAKFDNSISEICGVENEISGCDIVQNSEFSNLIKIEDKITGDITFQFPVSLAGLFYYIISLIFSSLILFKLIKNHKLSKKVKNIFLIFTTLGFISSVIFFIIQAFIIKAFCKFCIYSGIDTTIILILSSIFIYLLNKK